MLDKHSVIEATLYNEIGGLMFTFEDMNEVYEIYENTLITKSLLGFLANSYFDLLMGVSEEYNDFVRLVFTEIDSDAEELRLIMFLLYNKIPIEDEINKFILNHMVEEIIGG